MSVTSSRTIQIQFSGDLTENLIQSASDNALSPGKSDIISLVVGANVITAPVISGLVVTGLTIIPPAGNVNLMTLSGIPIHKTDPVSLSLDSTFVSLTITVTTAITGVRLIWT